MNISNPGPSESLSVIVLPTGWQFDEGHELASTLLVQLRRSPTGVIASTWLETEEHGWGSTEDEALMDLLSTLVEYMESLRGRQDRLGEPALADLDRLRKLIQPV